MKDYKEVAQDVLRRSLQEMEKEWQRKRRLMRGGCAVAAFSFVILISWGLRGERNLGQRDSSGIFASFEIAEKIGNGELNTNIAGGGNISDMDGGRKESFGNGVDGDPSGYSYDPVPGGKTEGIKETEEGEFDPESFRIVETEPANVPDGSSDINHPFSDGAVDSESKTMPRKKMISSYPEKGIYCYHAPGNGEFYCSTPLTHAIEKYGDKVLYRVVAELFCDETMLLPESEEAKLEWSRLEELGYTVVWESYNDGEEERHYYMLHATKKQLEEFDVSEEYGYFFRFMDEP